MSRLLAKPKGSRRPRLTVGQILTWADEHRTRTGRWPGQRSGPVERAPGETWCALNTVLWQGNRGLPGGDSLARLLARERQAPCRTGQQALSHGQILAWAAAHRCRTGEWPGVLSGEILEAPGENWRAVNMALYKGYRGLPGGDSLAKLLARERGALSGREKPPLTTGKIRAWAEAHRARTGRWPGEHSGPIPEAPGERWSAVCNALRQGNRGLPRGTSLRRLLRG
jgi:hypothetical protein